MPISLPNSAPHPSPGPGTASAVAPRLWVLIPCAGSGARAGASGPKQYQPLAGQPLVLHTLAAFAAVPRWAGVLLVVAPGDRFFDHHRVPCRVADCGGATRAQTVLNGLAVLQAWGAQDPDWVLVHDAARCLLTPADIRTLLAACEHDAVGGLLALPLPDTLKRAHGARVAETVVRADKWLAQTPQMFRIAALQQALRVAGDAVTDESSAIEAMGGAPLLVPGSAHNFKVTYPADFALAEAVLRSRQVPPTDTSTARTLP